MSLHKYLQEHMNTGTQYTCIVFIFVTQYSFKISYLIVSIFQYVWFQQKKAGIWKMFSDGKFWLRTLELAAIKKKKKDATAPRHLGTIQQTWPNSKTNTKLQKYKKKKKDATNLTNNCIFYLQKHNNTKAQKYKKKKDATAPWGSIQQTKLTQCLIFYFSFTKSFPTHGYCPMKLIAKQLKVISCSFALYF